MKFLKKIVALPELYCILLFIVTLVVGLAYRVSVENVSLTRNGSQENVSLPITQKMDEGELFQVELDINGKVSYDLKVIPDDCAESIMVNGESIDLRSFRGRCDFSKGFVLPDSVLSPHRVGERTHYIFFLKNNGGNAGLNVFVLQSSVLSVALNALSIFWLALFCLMLARRLKFGWGLAFLIFAAVFFRAVFFANIPYTTYSNDVDGHVAYVQYILEKHAIPGVDDCWTCYHPPVYYASAGPSFVVSEALRLPGTTGLQAFSLLLSILTLFFGVLFLKTFLNGGALGVASVLWTFWPLMILMSPRIGNDQMFCMLHVLCLWGGANYLKKGHGKYLIISVVATALAMWTKTTGIVTVGTLFLFTFLGYIHNSKSLKPTKSEIVAWGLFIALIAGIALQRLLGDADLVGNSSGLNGRLKVANEAFNYIYFDLQSFMTHPFTSAWEDEMGRQYFWNYSFKSALTGEFSMGQDLSGRSAATFVSASFLGLLVYSARGFWKTKLQTIHWILLLQGVAFIAALMFLRIKHPFACSNDFRYIAPAILSFIPFVALGVTLKESSVKWKVLGYAIIAAFALSTIVLYILAM